MVMGARLSYGGMPRALWLGEWVYVVIQWLCVAIVIQNLLFFTFSGVIVFHSFMLLCSRIGVLYLLVLWLV